MIALHELGIMIEVVSQVESFAIENNVMSMEALVLQIGELSSVVPDYLKKIYPMAAEGTMLENTRLEIEIIPGNARCKACSQVYNLLQENGKCPQCGSEQKELLSGREFFIKEIVCYDTDEIDNKNKGV